MLKGNVSLGKSSLMSFEINIIIFYNKKAIVV